LLHAKVSPPMMIVGPVTIGRTEAEEDDDLGDVVRRAAPF
jgi:hypothetical protein